MEKIEPRRGFLRSASINRTFTPDWAMLVAMFIEVVVLPSPFWLDVTRIFLNPARDGERSKVVRSLRKASQIGDRPSELSINSSPPFTTVEAFEPSERCSWFGAIQPRVAARNLFP